MNTSDSAGRDSGAEKLNWIDRRREKIRAEIERNRRGEHRVPTWVLAAVLVLIVVGWLSFVFLAG
ncbi:hypothetical protein O7602_14900 [Micromonospora sp. WMMD1128]|uniref:hypothetical protein n=1 Tax=unclassified Micromonospora TaxID=2617518 RepID=UPI00248D178E|nr:MULTISPECIES: hypothetical protein [unclassified Micromonospora]WBB76741.1 hypothetical protein O7602_14900 [Micromonospora sp. WMMD1128]WFE35474.1 hypothetical protein O7613_08870 [Micromonospora sp. WMMD975]